MSTYEIQNDGSPHSLVEDLAYYRALGTTVTVKHDPIVTPGMDATTGTLLAGYVDTDFMAAEVPGWLIVQTENGRAIVIPIEAVHSVVFIRR